MDFWAMELLNENMGFETQKGMKAISQLALPPSFLLNRFAVAEVFLYACVCVYVCACTRVPTQVHAYLPCVSMGTLDFRKHFYF